MFEGAELLGKQMGIVERLFVLIVATWCYYSFFCDFKKYLDLDASVLGRVVQIRANLYKCDKTLKSNTCSNLVYLFIFKMIAFYLQ